MDRPAIRQLAHHLAVAQVVLEPDLAAVSEPDACGAAHQVALDPLVEPQGRTHLGGPAERVVAVVHARRLAAGEHRLARHRAACIVRELALDVAVARRDRAPERIAFELVHRSVGVLATDQTPAGVVLVRPRPEGGALHLRDTAGSVVPVGVAAAVEGVLRDDEASAVPLVPVDLARLVGDAEEVALAIVAQSDRSPIRSDHLVDDVVAAPAKLEHAVVRVADPSHAPDRIVLEGLDGAVRVRHGGKTARRVVAVARLAARRIDVGEDAAEIVVADPPNAAVRFDDLDPVAVAVVRHARHAAVGHHRLDHVADAVVPVRDDLAEVVPHARERPTAVVLVVRRRAERVADDGEVPRIVVPEVRQVPHGILRADDAPPFVADPSPRGVDWIAGRCEISVLVVGLRPDGAAPAAFVDLLVFVERVAAQLSRVGDLRVVIVVVKHAVQDALRGRAPIGKNLGHTFGQAGIFALRIGRPGLDAAPLPVVAMLDREAIGILDVRQEVLAVAVAGHVAFRVLHLDEIARIVVPVRVEADVLSAGRAVADLERPDAALHVSAHAHDAEGGVGDRAQAPLLVVLELDPMIPPVLDPEEHVAIPWRDLSEVAVPARLVTKDVEALLARDRACGREPRKLPRLGA
ncbi:hypothetical protein [Sorangium sp. So ce1024]|uniref:hypothetical protein n=1 Tax=Sorangium sp. So ce1024 TaxID=3133327 RepID=UPI003F128433